MLDLLLGYLMSLGRIVEVALGIGFVIFVHELGHFLVAKRVGIRVETFSLGFGSRLGPLWFKRGDTEYRVSWVPLGGYVKMAGENPDEPATGAGDEYASKPVGSRAAVIVAGVCMNTIFAVVAFLIAFKVGVEMDAPAVGRVQPGSAAEQAGLRYGDEILTINDRKPLEFMDIALSAAYASGPLELRVERAGKVESISVVPRKAEGSPVQQLGFGKMEAIALVDPGSAGAAAGLRKDDRILAVGGRPMVDFMDFHAAVRASPGVPLAVSVKRGAEYVSVTLTPRPLAARTYGVTLAATPVVGTVVEKSAAADAGLLAGDVLIEVASAPGDVRTLRETIGAAPSGTAVQLTVQRGAQRLTLPIVPRIDPADGKPRLGIHFGPAIVAAVAPGSPAAAAGIAATDRIVEVNRKRFQFADLDALDQIANSPDGEKPIKVKLAKAGAPDPATVTLSTAPMPGRLLGDAGIAFGPATFPMRADGILEPIRLGFDRTVIFMEQVFLTFTGMFARRIDPTTLGGPIGIATAAYHVSESGLGKLIYFLAIISVNLAVLNILPIPVLDGGHLVFLAIEKAKGSPLSPNVQATAQWVGIVLLLSLMVYVTKNDIVRTFLGN